MEKIPTIFERDERHRLIPKLAVDARELRHADAVEKIDGTNVRLTVRSYELVRIEARRNPTKGQKARGIVEPWYRDVWVAMTDSGPEMTVGEFAAVDRYVYEAAANTVLEEQIIDGEWSAEAIGPKVQGNPLRIEGLHTCVIFTDPTTRDALTYHQAPVAPVLNDSVSVQAFYLELREWLEGAKSLFADGYGTVVRPEGLVWWTSDGDGRDYPVGKIKWKDFR